MHFINQLLIALIIMGMGSLWLCIVALVAMLSPDLVLSLAFALILIASGILVASGTLYEEITNRKEV